MILRCHHRPAFGVAVASLLLLIAWCRTAAADPQSRRAEVFERIDSAFGRGEISAEERLYYRVAALKAPQRLPQAWRQLVTHGSPSPGCYTPVLVEAAQQLPRLSDPLRSEIRGLLWPPDLTYTVEVTTPFPIRVSYNNPALASMAQTALDAAVDVYETEVTDWGFWEPGIEPGAGYFRIFIDDTGMGGGAYTAPYDEDYSTNRFDYYTYIVVDPANYEASVPVIVAHEFNHACQAAMDGAEVMPFWENTATYIMGEVYPADFMVPASFFPYFQAEPYRALEYGNNNGFQYGAAIWIIFLEQLYGQSDPRFIRQVWEGSVQNSSHNEPDYFDVLADMLASDGGFDEAVRTFAQYRFFASNDDDGQHLDGAGYWPNSEVDRIATHESAALPVSGSPPGSERPAPNGCNFVVVQVNEAGGDLVFSLEGESGIDWNVDVLRVASGEDTTDERMPIDGQGNGSLQHAASAGDRFVMVVCHLAPAGYDPDTSSWTLADYTYSIERLSPAGPALLEVQPSEVVQGTEGLSLDVVGTGFVDGATVAISGDGLTVGVAEWVSSELLRVTLSAAAEATVGGRDVTVTNPDGQSAVGIGMLNILAATTPPDPGASAADPEEDSGCGCRVGRASPSGSVPLGMGLLLLSLWFARRRRDRSSLLVLPA